jgi:hypothetical protein
MAAPNVRFSAFFALPEAVQEPAGAVALVHVLDLVVGDVTPKHRDALRWARHNCELLARTCLARQVARYGAPIAYQVQPIEAAAL